MYMIAFGSCFFSVCFHLIFVFVWRSLYFFCFTLFVDNDVGGVVLAASGLFVDCLLSFFVIAFVYIHKCLFALFGWVVCLLLLFILRFKMLFSLLLRFDHFYSDRLFCLFYFFFLFSCVYVSWAVYACTGGTWEPLTPPLFAYMICGWRSCVDLVTLAKISPSHNLAKIVPCESICASVCLVVRLLSGNAYPCIHPNPSPPS